VTFAYPFGDVVIAFFVFLTIRGSTGSGRIWLWCLLGGLMMMAATDSISSYVIEAEGYSGTGPLDVGWFAAYLGIALAAYTALREVEPAAVLAHPRPSLASALAPLLAVILALTVAAVDIRLGNHLGRASWLMAFALIALVLIRQGLVALELLGPAGRGRADLMGRFTETMLGPPEPR